MARDGLQPPGDVPEAMENPNASLKRKWVRGLLILGLIMAGAATLLYINGGRPKVNEHTITIDAPPDVVFTWITQPTHMTLWLGGYKGSEPLNEPGLYVGARTKEIIQVEKARYELTMEVVRVETGRLLEVKFDSGQGAGFTSTSRYELAPADGGTQLSFHQEASYRGFWPRLFSIAITKQSQRKMEQDLANLKKLIETPATAPDQTAIGPEL